MAYYTDGIWITAGTSHTDKVVQCYVSGDLVDWQRPQGGVVRFVLRQAAPTDVLLLLAVDGEDAQTDYWPAVLAAGQAHGSRVRIEFRHDMLDGRQPGDVWRVYRGEAGWAEATILLHQAELYPGGRGATGWGFDWGRGGWGLSGSNAPGWGRHWGSTWGFGIDFLRYTTAPLARGTYPLKVDLADRHGNASAACETTVVIDGFARPAEDLAVSSYAPDGDTLELSMTPSEDLS